MNEKAFKVNNLGPFLILKQSYMYQIDYLTIKTTFPKSFLKLQEFFDEPQRGLYIGPSADGTMSYWDNDERQGTPEHKSWDDRNLYDFFDHYGIYAFPEFSIPLEHSTYTIFYSIISKTKGNIPNLIRSDGFYTGRREIEKDMFVRCFEKLEAELK